MSSTICFNLEQSKMFLSGNELSRGPLDNFTCYTYKRALALKVWDKKIFKDSFPLHVKSVTPQERANFLTRAII